MHRLRLGWRALSLLLAAAGGTHLLRPRTFAPIVPRSLGAPGPWVVASGVAELVCAAALAAPRTRRRAGLVTAALFVAVFPANVRMAQDSLAGRSGARRAVALARLPLQVPLVTSALAVARQGRPA